MMTIAENYQRFIRDSLTTGDDELKHRVIKAFYDRVMCPNNDYVLKFCTQDRSFRAVSKSDPSDKFTFCWDGKKWRHKFAMSDATIAELLGVPVAFLYGMLAAVELMNETLDKPHIIASKVSEAEKILAEVKAMKKRAIKGDPKTIAKSFRRNAERQLKLNRNRRQMVSLTKKALFRFNKTCEHHDMPQIPKPIKRARDYFHDKPFSGVYIEWDGLLCAYVGQSANVPARLRTHQKVNQDSLVSVIHTDQYLRHEYFYIWLLNPYKNGGLGNG